MALIIEDGTGKTDSQTYVSADDLTAYALARAITITAADDTAKEALLITAMDYIESQNFKGDKGSAEQALQWPRLNVKIDGYYVDSDEIPQLLKDSQMEVALSVDGGTNPMANEERTTKREKVDVIEVEYSDNALSKTYLTAAETKLAKLVHGNVGVYRK